MRILFILLSSLLCVIPASSFAQTNDETQALVQASSMLNINTADQQQLQSLKGIGSSKAQAIINYREEHGAFKQAKDIVLVKGIGEKIYLDNQHLISVGQ